MTEFTAASLFTGIGGLDLGFRWESFGIVWANDTMPAARDSYRLNFRFQPSNEDANEIDFASLPHANLVIGGPPCQAFSLVGQRKQGDPRGQLVFRFLEAVRAMDPDGFVMENVPGMAASKLNGERLPDVLAKSFQKLGYRVNLTSLVATDFLVPQLRKRLFLLGCKRWRPEAPQGDLFAREVYETERRDFDLSSKAAIGDLGDCTGVGGRALYRKIQASDFGKLMRGKGMRSVSLHECPRMSATDKKLLKYIPPGGDYRNIPDEVATPRIMKFKKTGGRTTTYARLHPDRPAYTINTYFRRPNVGSNFHYSEPRLITAREAMRFQSLPDNIEIVKCAQDTRNALIGNAVPPLMARAVAWSMRKALIGEPIIQSRLV